MTGNRKNDADALNHTVRSRADGAGRVRETVDAENRVTVMTYDANGNRLSVRDPNNTGQDCVCPSLQSSNSPFPQFHIAPAFW
jgi:YD repeat-containing protein